MKTLKRIINNVPVTILKTNKFKSVAGKLYFKSPITKEKMSYRLILRNILMESCKKYDTEEKLYKKSLENYDAYYSASSSRIGNYHITSFSFGTLKDEYTEQGNLNEVINTFCEIIFNPLVKNNAFDKETFDIILNTKKAALEKVKENSETYSERMTYKNLNSKKPYTYMSEIKYLDELTPSKLYRDYLNMLNDSEIKLILAGDIDFDNEIITKITSNIKNNKVFKNKLLINNDDEKEGIKVIKEKGNGTQSILNLVMNLKNVSEYELNYVAPLYRIILGGGAFSRLFSVIREENQLAYYSFSRYEKDDALMLAIMGIEKENFDKAYDLTLEVINSMKKISEKELVNAKETLITSFLEQQDSILNIVSMQHNKELFNLPDSDLFIEKINGVLVSEIESFASKVKPCLGYFLEGE